MAGEREVSSAHRTGMAEALARYCSCISVAMDTRVALFRYTETFRISSLYVFYKSGRVEGGRERVEYSAQFIPCLTTAWAHLILWTKHKPLLKVIPLFQMESLEQGQICPTCLQQPSDCQREPGLLKYHSG